MNREMEILINAHPVRIELAQGRIKPKVVCLGPAGTYTEAARHGLLGSQLSGMEDDFLPANAMVVQQVDLENYDLGIVPVENSTEGDVGDVLRELAHANNLTILGETILGIQHMLIGYPEELIEEVRSHRQALGQCRSFLLANYPNIRQEEADSTAAAAESVKKNRRVAAIASRRVAEINDLPILAEDIGDIKGNSTRFLLIGRGETYATGADSTNVIFTPQEDRSGILARCLVTLSSYGLNLTKIDSRPSGVMGTYHFLTTLDGHKSDEQVAKGLADLERTYCSSLRILGSYRKAVLPAGVKEPGTINGE